MVERRFGPGRAEMTEATKVLISEFYIALSCRFLGQGDLDDINAGMAKAFAAQREEWKRVDATTYAPAPLFTPEEIAIVQTIAGLIGGDGMLVGPLPNGSATLERIAEKMSAPSEKEGS